MKKYELMTIYPLDDEKSKIAAVLDRNIDVNRNSMRKFIANDIKSMGLTLDNLKSKYITEDDLKDGNNKKIEGFVVYDNSDETYTFCFESANSCKENDTTICNTSLVCK